ncbi:MAG: hypothetical protein IJO72_02545 [Oscillospiraceae bacterium]|nr:hypothetical protein [Oscillospiraceae bacterium]MBQ9929642.1 hypothetical protein [Oscillospiraceae bacterium]
MKITHRIKMNLEEAERLQRLEMPLGDTNSREIEMYLYANQNMWTIPEDVAVVIRYKKPDGTVGEYDTLPDGTVAWSAVDNVLTIALVPQMLTVAGSVVLYVTLYYGEAVAQTYGLEILVKAPTADMPNYDTQDYANMTHVLRGPVIARQGQILTVDTVDDYGRVTAVGVMDAAQLVDENGSAVLHKQQNLTINQKIQARANIEAASQALVDFLMAKFTVDGLALSDERTTDKYSLYVSNGKLTLEKE